MSLINKMLQDLDARAGQPGAAPLPGDVRLPPAAEPRAPWVRGALAVGALAAVAVVGVIGWRALGESPAPVVASAPAPVQVLDVAPPAPPPAALEPEPEPAPQPQALAPKPRKEIVRAPAPRKPAAPAVVAGRT